MVAIFWREYKDKCIIALGLQYRATINSLHLCHRGREGEFLQLSPHSVSLGLSSFTVVAPHPEASDD